MAQVDNLGKNKRTPGNCQRAFYFFPESIADGRNLSSWGQLLGSKALLYPFALEAIVMSHYQASECKNKQDENCDLNGQNLKFRDGW
jgi:hypothetical protein